MIGHSCFVVSQEEKREEEKRGQKKSGGRRDVYKFFTSCGAGRGNRTPTVLSDLRILSPLRLPISPSRLAIILAYQPVNLAWHAGVFATANQM